MAALRRVLSTGATNLPQLRLFWDFGQVYLVWMSLVWTFWLNVMAVSSYDNNVKAALESYSTNPLFVLVCNLSFSSPISSSISVFSVFCLLVDFSQYTIEVYSETLNVGGLRFVFICFSILPFKFQMMIKRQLQRVRDKIPDFYSFGKPINLSSIFSTLIGCMHLDVIKHSAKRLLIRIRCYVTLRRCVERHEKYNTTRLIRSVFTPWGLFQSLVEDQRQFLLLFFSALFMCFLFSFLSVNWGVLYWTTVCA